MSAGQRLAGKVAVVTGGNSGIGFASAKAFVTEGAKVAILGRNAEAINKAAAELGENAIGIRGDVSKISDLENFYKEVSQKLGKIDTIFVNAGIAPVSPLDVVSEDFFDNLFDINVKGAYFTIQKALPYLNDNASIILNTSVANKKGMPGLSVYSATKSALRSFARSLSAELIGKGIRVNAVSPGMVETPLLNKMGLPPEAVEEFGNSVVPQIPLQRAGKPDEIAGTVVFLASDESSYIVGAEIEVDGGFTQV